MKYRSTILPGIFTLLALVAFGQETVPLATIQTSAFEENHGQVADDNGVPQPDVLFTLKHNSGTVYFRKHGLSYQWSTLEDSPPEDNQISEATGKPANTKETNNRLQHTYRVDMVWNNANQNATITGYGEKAGYSNYFLPHCSNGVVNVRHFSKIKYINLYPGIDIEYYINERGNLKYDILLEANADISKLSFDFIGASPLLMNGKLNITAPLGNLEEQTPVAWVAGDKSKLVDVAFVKTKKGIGYKLPQVNKPIVVDPEIIWTTYYGGTESDEGNAVQVDASGNVFLSGVTQSTTLAASPGCITTKPTGTSSDAYIVKFNRDGNMRLWATYYGGSSTEGVSSMALDPSGNVVIGGRTQSNNLPLVLYDNSYSDNNDAFIAKFSGSGECQWATYYGENDNDYCNAVATDQSGNIYLGGTTENSINDINTSPSGFDKTYSNPLSDHPDAFLVKFNSTGTTRLWATYYGGEYDEEGLALAVDENNNVYLAGKTSTSTTHMDADIATPGSFKPSETTGSAEGFIVKFNEQGIRQWGSYFGGTADDQINSIALDRNNNLYICGTTYSISGLATAGAYRSTKSWAGQDAFVAKINDTGTTLFWASYFGGNQDDFGNALTVNNRGDVFLLGETKSSGLAQSGFDNTYSGNYDTYIAMLTTDGSSLTWASYFGGVNNDFAEAIAKDDLGIYITGRTATPGLATTGVFQPTYALGGADAYLAKILIPEITEEDYPEVAEKTGSTPLSITVNSMGSSVGKLWSKGITEDSDGWTSETITPNGNTLTKNLSAADLTDPLGLSYYFEITDNTGVLYRSNEGKTHLRYQSGLTIPGLSFGNKVENYQIISVPFQLDNQSVDAVFDELGLYNKKQWRLFSYYENDNREYPGFSSLQPGKGYWLIIKDNTIINTGAGRTVPADETSPFEIALTQGWNLIGNPYDFPILWQDVLDFNEQLTGEEQLITFENKVLAEANGLNRYQGGFVNSPTNTTIEIPVLKKDLSGGRKGNTDQTSELDEPQWVVPLHLTNGAITNKLGGIGMHPDAQIIEKDNYDRLSVPLLKGMGLFELQVNYPNSNQPITKDIVPTKESYTWRITINRDESIPVTLQWDNAHFGENEKELFLFYPHTQKVVNMRQASSTELSTETNHFLIIYGNSLYVQDVLDQEMLVFGHPYPTPSTEKVFIPIHIPKSAAAMHVTLSVFNTNGEQVANLLNNELQSGSYTLEWQAKSTGLYLLRFTAKNKTVTKKIIIR